MFSRRQSIGILAASLSVLAIDAASAAPMPTGRSDLNRRPRTSDIELAEEGLLIGAVIDDRGRPVAGNAVTIRFGQRVVFRTRTDVRGRFRVAGLRGGLFEVVSSHGTKHVRVWKKGLAPKGARRSILIVADKRVVRGQTPVVVPPPVSESLFFAGAATGVGFFVADVVNDADEGSPSPASSSMSGATNTLSLLSDSDSNLSTGGSIDLSDRSPN